MIEVFPSLPAASFAELKESLARVHGLVSAFQIDICDGMFVPNRSWPMKPGDKTQFDALVRGDEALPFWEELDFELHMMVHNPEKYLADWITIGISRALVHVEATQDFAACRAAAKDRIELGVAINLGTPVELLEAYMPYVSVVQVMGIAKIGVQGQPFDPRAIDVIAEVRKRYPDVIIEVDGAVNRETAPLLVAAGATRLAPGSFVLKSDNPKEAITFLKKLGN